MDSLKLWFANLKQVGLQKESICGLAYMTACLPTVLYFTYKLEKEYIKPLLPYLKDSSKSSLESYGNEEKFAALRIFDKFYRTARISPIYESGVIPIPSFSDELKEAMLDKNLQLFSKDQILVRRNFNPKVKNDVYNSLMQYIGEQLIGLIPSGEILDYFQIGYEHSLYWMTDDGCCASYSLSVLGSNYVPSYIGTIINSIPHPNSFSTNANTWLFSRELNYRIKGEEYDFDIVTQKWIWKLHNYIFYTAETKFPERKEKYEDANINRGYNEMLSDVFLNIIKFNNAFPLNSDNFEFIPKYQYASEWKDFVNSVDNNLLEKCGWEVGEMNVSGIGELHHIMSYRFLTAVLLYLHRK